MKNGTDYESLPIYKRALVLALGPFAVCGASFAIGLARHDGDRLLAAVTALTVSVALAMLPMFWMLFVRPSLYVSQRFTALMSAFTSATYAGLIAAVFAFGWTLIGFLHGREGRQAAVGVVALLFAAATLSLFALFSKRAFGLHPTPAVVLAICASLALACLGLIGSQALAWYVAVPSALVLVSIFCTIPRSVPPPLAKSLFTPPPPP